MIFLLIDVVIFLFINAYKLHKNFIKTSALEEKLVMVVIGTSMIDIFFFVGKIFEIQTQLFLTSSYLGFLGFFIVGFLIYLMIAEKNKNHIRETL
jgi:hypothetical protein